MILKIGLSKLKPGMAVVNPGVDVADHPAIYLVDRVMVDESEIKAIDRSRYTDVFVDTEQGPHFAAHPDEKEKLEQLFALLSGDDHPKDGQSANFDAVVKRLAAADGRCRELISYCRGFIDNLKNSCKIDLASNENFVESLIAAEGEDHQAIYLLSKLKNWDHYTYTHTLNVALLSTLFGKALNLGRDNLMILGLSGLYHDLGKLRIPDKIVKKPGKLTPRETALMRTHPTHSRDMLLEQGGVAAEVVRAVHEHHERFDGGGYPLALDHSKLSSAALLLSLIDAFDALTTDRCYAGAVHPHKAVCILFNLRGGAYSPALADRFVRFMGIYPVGSIVVLKDGAKAIVIEQNEGNLLKPKVRVILDAANRCLNPFDLDLAAESPDKSVVDCLSNKECRIHIDAYLQRTRRRGL